MVTSALPTRPCNTCGLEKPIGEFRRRYRDTDRRHNECNDCFAKYTRYRRAVNRGKLIRGFVAQVNAASSRGVVAAVCANLVRRLGGVERLGAEFAGHLEAAAEARPGSRMVLNTFRAIANLMLAAEQEKPEPVNVRELTDDELDFSKRELDRQIEDLDERQYASLLMEGAEQLIQSQPELAVAAAERLGWTVIPPSEDEDGEK